MLTKAGLYPTSIDVPLDARAALLPLLNRRLADMVDLFNQTKHAHWNVKGPGFIALHELFSRALDKDLWFLEAHQTPETSRRTR